MPPEMVPLLSAEPTAADLTPAERESLAMVAEECAEVIAELAKVQQQCTKILRYGLRVNPYNGVHCRDALEREIGDLGAVVEVAAKNGLIDIDRVSAHGDAKIKALHEGKGTRTIHVEIPTLTELGRE